MTWLRTTRPPRRAALLALALAAAGCGAPTPPSGPAPSVGVGTDDPAWVTLRTRMPAPDPDRIGYDENTRTLALYDLPGNDRWMVMFPGDEDGRPAAPRQRVPADADLGDVYVYYVRPGMKRSFLVSVQQIRDTGRAHSSLAVLK